MLINFERSVDSLTVVCPFSQLNLLLASVISVLEITPILIYNLVTEV